MIVIIDYDMGNLASIKNMLHKIGYDEVKISRNIDDIKNADKLILPGVGAFDQGVSNMHSFGLFDAIKDAVLKDNKPIMGICLGMQLLGRKSEEGELEGLSLLPFDSVRFRLNDDYKIPHMGWSYVDIKKEDSIVDDMQRDENRFYFVHSFHAVCDDTSDVLMTCNYGYDFVAGISKGNIYGFQFHPEKSHKYGMQMFKNFVRV